MPASGVPQQQQQQLPSPLARMQLEGAQFEAMVVPATARRVFLPVGAIPKAVAPAPAPAPSPTSQPQETPNNVASTLWRTQACPYAPMRRDFLYASESSSAVGTPATSPVTQTSSQGMLPLMPTALFASASPTATPTSECVLRSFSKSSFFGEPDWSAGSGDCVLRSFSSRSMSGEADSGTAAGVSLLREVPGEELGQPCSGHSTVAAAFDRLSSGHLPSAAPRLPCLPSRSAGASSAAPPAADASPAPALMMPQPIRPRPPCIRTSWSRSPSSSPMNSVGLNTGFVATPGSYGFFEPSPCFPSTSPAMTVAGSPSMTVGGSPNMTSLVWAQVFSQGATPSGSEVPESLPTTTARSTPESKPESLGSGLGLLLAASPSEAAAAALEAAALDAAMGGA